MGKRPAEAEELDLVPIMNLVTILIPFLLMAAQFVSYAVIDSTLPAIGPPTPPSEDTTPPLNLTIVVTDEGYSVKGSAGSLKGEGAGGVTLPCLTAGCTYTPRKEKGNGPSEAYDVAGLREMLVKVKSEYADENNVILAPDSDIPYEVLVLTMDVSREHPDLGKNSLGGEETPKEIQKLCGDQQCLFPLVVIAGGASQ
jgi:hypothetical protein